MPVPGGQAQGGPGFGLYLAAFLQPAGSLEPLNGLLGGCTEYAVILQIGHAMASRLSHCCTCRTGAPTLPCRWALPG